MTQIVLASRNAKKSAEIDALLAPHEIRVVSVSEFEGVPEVVEDGQTFGQNAAKKASEVAQHLKKWAIGEDSGLCVDALGGAPGIYSARFSGEEATDEKNNQELIKRLDGIAMPHRGAHYVCHVCLSDPEGNVQVRAEGVCHGLITEIPQGSQGFGYDPYFLVPGYNRTFAELGPEVKQKESHRARAFAEFIPQLIEVIAK